MEIKSIKIEGAKGACWDMVPCCFLTWVLVLL